MPKPTGREYFEGHERIRRDVYVLSTNPDTVRGKAVGMKKISPDPSHARYSGLSKGESCAQLDDEHVHSFYLCD